MLITAFSNGLILTLITPFTISQSHHSYDPMN